MDSRRFQILRRLGAGGMGEVFLAEDRLLGREVALKSLTVQGEARREAELRFLRESRLMATIRHPGLLEVYDVVEEDGRWIMVMEYVQGRDLEATLKEAGYLPLARVIRLAREIGPALDALHAKGVLHRDIKPANIMLRQGSGQAIVMDLGLAREEGGTVMTRTGSMLGTPLYMPPEVVLGKGWSERGDVFQLAAVLFRSATGQNHVGGAGLVEVFQHIAGGEWNPFPIAPALPAAVRQALTRGLAPDPTQRFGSCQELLDFLDPSETQEVSSALPGIPSASVPSREWGLRRRGLWGVALLMLLGGLALSWLGRSPPGGELRWSVVGERVEVCFQAPDPEGFALEVAGIRQQGAEPKGPSRWRLRFDHLVAGQEEQARLRYREQVVESRWVKGEAPALELSELPLTADLGVAVEVQRPCRATLDTEPEVWAELETGSAVFPLEVRFGAPLPEALRWQEGKQVFSRELTWAEYFEDQIRRVSEELRAVEVDASLRSTAPRFAGSPLGGTRTTSFEEYRKVFRGIREWVPWLLTCRDLDPALRRDFFRLWQIWSRSVAQEVIQGLGEIEPLEVPPGMPGAMNLSPPDWPTSQKLSLAVRHPFGKRQGYLALDNFLEGETDQLQNRGTTKVIDFRWPERVPKAGELACLAFQVGSLEQWIQLEVLEPEGPFRAYLWEPDPKAFLSDHEVEGWLSLVFPADLGPTPGATMELKVRDLLTPQVQFARIYQARVCWIDPAAAP